VNNKPIQNVSDTAHWIANYRAIESARKDALFKDPLAAVLAHARGKTISGRMGLSKIMGWSVSLRTFIIDGYIKNAIADGVDTVVNLGAGLDTRPYRLEVSPELKWIEVDFPQVLDFKEEHLKGEKPRCDLRRIRLDLSDTEARGKLLSEINATSKKVLVLTEGVIIYLTVEDVASLGEALASQSHFHFWIVDYFSPGFMNHYRQGRIGKLLENNVPFRFFPEKWEEFFKSNGWSLKEIRYLSEEGRKLGRPTPTPLFYRILLRFMPSSQRNSLKRMTGYAVLSR
jgi:methyltransferase (TIGR00027 family)